MTEAPIISNQLPGDTIAIDNLDQFVSTLTGWHKAKVAMVKHLLEVPEGSVFEVGEQSLELNGDALAGFKFGLEMALMQLGELPFVAEVEDAPVGG